VTIGVSRNGGDGVPVVGDRVELGAYAQVLGDIKIGDGAKIGAMAVVLDDVPAGGVAFAPKATIRPPR
jgi:serine O-acetyltransferase